MTNTTKLDPIETASIDELQALQTERLKWTLHHAYNNVPMYKRKFDAAGVHPDDFKTLEDIRKFPCTTKQDLRDNYPFDTFAVPMEQVVRIHASSGTTGKPTVVGYTQHDIDNWANLVARSLRAAGGSAKDKIHVAYGYGLFTGGLGAHYGAERLGATVIPMSGGQTEKQAQLIRDFQPDMIMVTPSYCLNLIEELERQMGGDASAAPAWWGCLAQSRGRRPCAAKSRNVWGSPRWISMGFPRSWGQAWRWSVSKPPTVRPSGKTISIRRSSTQTTARRLMMASRANCCSPR